MAEVEVWLSPTVKGNHIGHWDYTDEKGWFAIKAIEPGDYVLVLNKDGEKRIEEPFAALYYPGVADEASAKVFRFRAGDNLKGLKIIVPHIEEMVTVRGVVRFADGTPAPGTTVRFVPAKRSGIDGQAMQDSDAKGRFSFKIFKGLPGELHADFFAHSGDTATLLRKYNYENCPQVQSIIKQTGENMMKTLTLKVDPQHDLLNVVLKFPFRACK
jgi:hypothetical protein